MSQRQTAIANTVAVGFGARAAKRVIRQQQEAIRELSTSRAAGSRALLILPIIGVIDPQRAPPVAPRV